MYLLCASVYVYLHQCVYFMLFQCVSIYDVSICVLFLYYFYRFSLCIIFFLIQYMCYNMHIIFILFQFVWFIMFLQLLWALWARATPYYHLIHTCALEGWRHQVSFTHPSIHSWVGRVSPVAPCCHLALSCHILSQSLSHRYYLVI